MFLDVGLWSFRLRVRGILTRKFPSPQASKPRSSVRSRVVTAKKHGRVRQNSACVALSILCDFSTQFIPSVDIFTATLIKDPGSPNDEADPIPRLQELPETVVLKPTANLQTLHPLEPSIKLPLTRNHETLTFSHEPFRSLNPTR